ncbi:related to aminotransferase [Lecanosticta acicola]|uniref:Related to aminotransferase n=1 Tax=Lecanosticta acicola TaxID=111012 RepID=A0AAI8YS09_9PEZI|nr:related to aminotransferase [Lecanosticta acicola]
MSAPIEFGSDRATAPINLLRGWPNPSLLPVDLLKEAADAVLSDTSIAHPGLLYGPDEGYAPFREAVAAWLNAFYKPERPIESSRICINGGASQSLGSLLNVYTDPEYTRNVWFVAPAYMLAFRVFEDAGFAGKMRAVPEDEEGIDIAYLARELAKSEEKAKSRGNTQPLYKPDRQRAKVYKHVVYCVPTFSNPSSRTMSLQRRRELVRLARDFDALVTCDDVYDFLQWPTATDQVGGSGIKIRPMKTAHLPRLVDVDRSLDGGAGRQGADGFGNVCSNGTFSKLAGPGLRCGWVEGTEKFSYGASQAGTQRSGGAPCQLTSTYITKVVASGELQRHIETVLQPAYASRYKTMAKAIEDHLLPLGFSMPQPNRDVIGGYFIWLGLPADLKGHELVQKCQDGENLIVSPGSAFEVPGDESISFASNVRLCFAWEDEWKLREGVKRIGKVAKRLLERGDDGSEDYVVVENGDEDRLQASK